MKLPEGWVETNVGRVVLDLQPGFAQRPGEDDSGMTPQIRTHNVNPEGIITLNGIKYVSASSKEIEKYGLSIEDVVFNNTNSEEWVGKTAVFDQPGNFVFSNHMTRLRVDRTLINPRFLARYLHQLWSMGYSKTRAKRWVSQSGIEGVALASFKLPLPTLLEQQRIVDMLQQVSSIQAVREEIQERIGVLSREYYARLFGDVFLNNSGWPVAKLGGLSDIVRGSSPRPQGDPRLFGGPVPRLMVSDLTRDGLWVSATTDSLTLEGAKSSRPMPAHSVVIAVSGAPGLTAILNHDACIHDGFVGLRDLRADLLPEFVAFTLNLLRVRNDQQAVGAVFRNLTTDQVKSVAIPTPPIDLQRQFQSFLLQVRSIHKDIERSGELADQLKSDVSVDAFAGELTAAWRELHQRELVVEAQLRDAALRERGVVVSTQLSEPEQLRGEIERNRPAREWILGELGEFQRRVLEAFIVYPLQPLLAEDPDVFGAFCSDDGLVASLTGLSSSPIRIRRTLAQLSALGLIAKITVPKTDLRSGEREYLKAFRPLRDDENTRLADIERLRGMLKPVAQKSLNYFEVTFDHVTSESPGGLGESRLLLLTDREGRVREDLVKTGKQYASADAAEAIKKDIAEAMGVSPTQIDLHVSD